MKRDEILESFRVSVSALVMKDNEIKMGASSLASGSYILRIIAENETIVKKFVKTSPPSRRVVLSGWRRVKTAQ